MEKAAVSLAVAAVSPIITKLSNKAASFFGGDITHNDINDLTTTILPKITAVLKAVNKIDADELRPWLMKLKAAMFEAEDVLDEYDYNGIKNKVSSLPIPLKKLKGKAKKHFGELLLKTKLKKSLEKLRESANEADKLIPLLSLISQTDARQHVTNEHHTTVSGLSSPVFGRDEELKSLINLLVDYSPASTRGDSDSSNNIHVHAICGAGKTTLAKYFYNSERVAAHFDLKIWVLVSSSFNAIKITKDIIESALGDGKSAPDGNNLDVLQKKVKEVLKSKTYLLALDDTWCEDRHKWDELLIPFNGVGNNESRILITTRTEHVASILGIKSRVSLNELKTEDCRSILKHYAFGGESKYIQDPDLQDVLEQIVQTLKHSPLAARVIGCLLGKEVKIDKWKMILKDDLLKGTKDTLLLSFYHLPSHLQRCFAFCSLYPKGFHFTAENDHFNFCFKDVDDLVRRWIALGFVECPNNVELTLEERGRQYFNNLVSYSFFQSHKSYDDDDVYVIHDLLHDLAEDVSKDDCLRIEGDRSLPIPKTIMHLSITSDYLDHMSSRQELFMLDNLRTFMILSSPKDEIDIMILKKIFENLRKLRVLDLGEYKIPEFDSSVSQLKHLQYLKAGMVGKLSKSFCRLYHLQYLTLKF